MNDFYAHAEEVLLRGDIAVIPTDTLYGIVARANDVEAVERVYAVRGRNLSKPVIVLIAEKKDLALFDIILSLEQNIFLDQVWPRKVSVILPCAHAKFKHIHRGSEGIAFRVPDKEVLRELLKKTGPLIAPSANKEGLPPAETIGEARAYFGDQVEIYCDGGTLVGSPSTLVSLIDGETKVLRG